MTSQTYMAYLEGFAKRCNYDVYLEKYLKYPPEGLLPIPGSSVEFDPDCDIATDVFIAALTLNPAFNVYRIFDVVSQCSVSWSPTI